MKYFAVILIMFFCVQNISAQNNTAPDMPIPQNVPPQQVPAPPPAAPQPDSPQPPPPAQMPVEPAPTSQAQGVSSKPQLPDDFELIAIKPYFKNKARLGQLTVTLANSQNETLATISGDFGDCKNCIRGASIKGKMGIRLYGDSVKDLTVSRKQSSSIKLENCPTSKVAFSNNTFSCEFSHKDMKMKMTIKLEP